MKLTHPPAPAAPPPQIVVSYGTTPTPEAAATLGALQRAVSEALDRKRRLGQYAVFWRDGKAVQVAPEDLPSVP